MKRNVFILFLLLSFVLTSVFSEGMLGLRTLEATQTQQATESSTQESIGLNLRTIDPLLISFKEGFKSPTLPGWKVNQIGEVSFKVPMGFGSEAIRNGVNYDGKITDANGETFAQLFLYQLEAYQLDELVNTLLKTLFGNRATGEKTYEEFKDLSHDQVAYFTRIYMNDQKITYPILFIYQKGESYHDILPGSILFLFFQPSQYQADADQEQLNSWIEGIAGSLIESMTTEKTEKVEKPEEKEEKVESVAILGENLGEKLAYCIENEIYLAKLPAGWKEAKGTYFSFWHPDHFTTDFYLTEDGEVTDLVYQEVAMAKIFVGETYDYVLEEDIFYELYQTYLSGLGTYKLVETTPSFGDFGSMVTYEMDFSGYKGWISLYSESDWEGNLYGEYLVFLGIAPYNELEVWEEDYLDILISMSF
ncbi:MAG TPA: hypothetical protein PLN92_07995 [Thermotogota bacterium]|nr:hypothetical protein [Thermotogota bacterium]